MAVLALSSALPLLLAQGMAGYSIVQICIMVIVVAAVVGIMFVFLRQAGITIPPFIITVFWIVLAAIICIGAIKIVAGL